MNSQTVSQTTIVVFDGVCNLCNGAVDFILTNDRTESTRFASFQSDVGRNLLSSYGVIEAPETIYVVSRGRLLRESDAVLALSSLMQQRWMRVAGRLAYVVPRAVRDILYRWVARNRYRWFGKREHCRLPRPSELDRFL